VNIIDHQTISKGYFSSYTAYTIETKVSYINY